MAALLFAVFAPSVSQLLDGRAATGKFESVLFGTGLGIVLAITSLWMFYRPGRQLYRAMVEANRNLLVVPIYSSDDLVSGLAELNGSRLASSGLPSSAYLVFVDAGRQFEIWKWHRRRPERVIRLSWAAVQSIDIGTISHLVIIDRALVLNVESGEGTVRIPIAPQECRAVRLRPVKDDVFNNILTGLQSRVAANRLETDPRHPNTTAKSSSESS